MLSLSLAFQDCGKLLQPFVRITTIYTFYFENSRSLKLSVILLKENFEFKNNIKIN